MWLCLAIMILGLSLRGFGFGLGLPGPVREIWRLHPVGGDAVLSGRDRGIRPAATAYSLDLGCDRRRCGAVPACAFFLAGFVSADTCGRFVARCVSSRRGTLGLRLWHHIGNGCSIAFAVQFRSTARSGLFAPRTEAVTTDMRSAEISGIVFDNALPIMLGRSLAGTIRDSGRFPRRTHSAS